MYRLISTLRSMAVLLALLVVGCEDAVVTDPTTPPAVGLVQVATPATTLAPGETTMATATVLATNGDSLTGRVVTWTSSDTTVATVDATGVVRAVGVGQADIRAMAGGKTGTTRIVVAAPAPPPPGPALQLSHLAPARVEIGTGPLVLSAIGTGFSAEAMIVWNGTPRPTVRVSDTELRALIPAEELLVVRAVPVTVRSGAGGTTTGTVHLLVEPGVVASIQVSPPTLTLSVGAQATLVATAYGAVGQVVENPEFTWSSTSPATVSVDQAGRITANHVGVVRITASAGGREASATIQVVLPVANVLVGPTDAAVLVNGQVQMQAMALAAGGGTLGGRQVTWSSDDPMLATVDQNGLVTGRAKGNARIRATIEGKTGTQVVEVRQFASGPTQVYVYRGPVGSMISPTVGTQAWTDGNGIVHEALQVLVGGTLTVHNDQSRYRQVLVLDLVVVGRGTVGQIQWEDEGAFNYGWPGPGYSMVSSGSWGTTTATVAGPGELHLNQAIGSQLRWPYRWVVQ